MIIREALAQTWSFLESAGIPESRLEAELLLGHTLEWERARVLAHGDDILTKEKEGALRDHVVRRSQREPLAYIVGHREFYGLKFLVDPRVMVPRPETELLVDEALAFAGNLQKHGDSAINIVDVGTGSGVIGITLAHLLKSARVWCIDISPMALQTTSLNVQAHGVEDRVRLVQGDLLDSFHEKADIIVANLPYISDMDLPNLEPEISLFEPPLALRGGPTGLELTVKLLSQTRGKLCRPGLFLAEIGAGQARQAMAAAMNFLPETVLSIRRDLAGLDRVLRAEL